MHAPDPHDRAVRGRALETADRTDTDVDPPAGRAGFHGALIGFALVTAAMTVVGLIGDLSLGGAIGLGVFVGVWGGVGFGAMLGATMCLARADDARIAAEKTGASGQIPVEVARRTSVASG